MKAPISWLKEYVEIKLPLKDLMWKLTEVGVTCETFEKIDNEIVLDIEVTPNRPDWFSIQGIAREIAAIQKTKVKLPALKNIPPPKKLLNINIKNDFALSPRFSAITISNLTTKPSPDWLREKIKHVGLRPINNIVDITNYVMFETGIPIHAFDYDKFKNKTLLVTKAKGGEKFTSVDGLDYTLPVDAIIIKNEEKVVDLCGIKGGLNSGIDTKTKNILLIVPIYNGILIRRTSQKLALSSDASKIFERGANAGDTIETLTRAVNLILEATKGEVSSKIIDQKKSLFLPIKLDLSISKLDKVLGLAIPRKTVSAILESLNLSPRLSKTKIACTIPTYREDIKIEEDLIEEVARIYGYNNFPRTLPVGGTNITKVPYFFDDSIHLKIKHLLTSCGYSEAMCLSLISKNLVENCQLNLASHIKLSNPVSLEYEYLRTSLVPSLLAATKLNTDAKLKLFELQKTYKGKPGSTEERYLVSGISKTSNFLGFRGTLETIFERLHIEELEIKDAEIENGLWHPFKSGYYKKANLTIGTFGEIHPKVLQNLGIKENILAFEFDISLLEKLSQIRNFKPIPKCPPQIEDVTLIFPAKTKIGEVVYYAIHIDKLITSFALTDTFGDSYTFRVWYSHPDKTLTDTEVEKVRHKLLSEIKKKFGGRVKN